MATFLPTSKGIEHAQVTWCWLWLSLTKRQPKTTNSLQSGRKSAFNPLPAVCKRWKTSRHAAVFKLSLVPCRLVHSPADSLLPLNMDYRWVMSHPKDGESLLPISLRGAPVELEARTVNGCQSHLSFLSRPSLTLKFSVKVAHYFHSLARWKAIFEGGIWGWIWEGFSQGESSDSVRVSIYSAAAAFYL